MDETRAWFVTRLREFATDVALNRLAARSVVSGHPAQQPQVNAWKVQLAYLDRAVRELCEIRAEAGGWAVLLEYPIPRRQRRIDAVILAEAAILVLEFKVFATTFDRGGRWQAEDYALDLRDFHAGSYGRVVIPFLVATEALASATPPLVDAVQCVGLGGHPKAAIEGHLKTGHRREGVQGNVDAARGP